jgi:hypothetical protein
MKATFAQNEIEVRYSVRPDVGKEFISFDIPNGWDDVKKISKKILIYENKRFSFSCWNSDFNYCVFARPIDGELKIAIFE